ncbi:IclR family transcriptional regulator [Demetria terragena]|uniref:IclR family transcriptional regulator n=1 Tax=Demetria terragena TaxID=63959 RepID=UPI000360030F|nr:IclR family transcriptional regulator [Demetria terragena]
MQSVDRALDLLEALSEGGPMGVSELVRATGLPLGTVHRILATLTERDYVRQDPERKYAVGAAALGLSDAGEQSLAALGRPYLARLTALTGESSNLAILQGHEMVYIAQSPSPHSLRIFAEVGRRVPLHNTAVGKAVLAQLGRDHALRLLPQGSLNPATPYTITTPEHLVRELDHIHSVGYSVDEQERELGVRCIAAAVPSPGPLRVAISVSGPSERFSKTDLVEVAPAVRTAARDFAHALTR